MGINKMIIFMIHILYQQQILYTKKSILKPYLLQGMNWISLIRPNWGSSCIRNGVAFLRVNRWPRVFADIRACVSRTSFRVAFPAYRCDDRYLTIPSFERVLTTSGRVIWTLVTKSTWHRQRDRWSIRQLLSRKIWAMPRFSRRRWRKSFFLQRILTISPSFLNSYDSSRVRRFFILLVLVFVFTVLLEITAADAR